ncbi:nucleotide-diphospho-sugar transferase [Obelidium mucronatum]|nr:nucleotide-diphospho-sugar transferase [Obelidium mucronatum]
MCPIRQTFLEWSQSWKLMNPDFRYVIWDDTENRELIMQHYPWFLKRYESFESPILKADASRIFYLHKYGGIYADLDVVSLRPIAPFIDGHELILGNMRTEAKPLFPFSQGAWNYLHGLPNAWMASRPGHPFWLLCAKLMMEYTNDMTVEELTGPVMIWRALTEYIRLGWHKENSVYIADSRFVFPYSWTWPSGEREHSVCSKQRATFNASKCLDMVDPHGEAFTITYWSHSWEEVIE